MSTNTSLDMRNDPLFMRNQFTPCGKWGLPLIRKQSIDLSDVRLIACSNTRAHDSIDNRQCGVHFFVDDYRFNDIYFHPERSLAKYSQYRFLLTPDYSTYSDMPPWRQLESVAHSRWCGAYWQSHGLIAIPTMTWSTPSNNDFNLDGVERHATVAVGMIGCKSNKSAFMYGYDAMLERIAPEAIICYGQPYAEMRGNLIVAPYIASRKEVH